MDLVKNIKTMYESGDGHVYVLAASIRNLNHLLHSFSLGVELVTVPAKVLEEWAAQKFPLPDSGFRYRPVNSSQQALKPIPYQVLNLNHGWETFDISHELTTQGIQKFVADYQSTLRRTA